jgi:hypothetical protein
LIEQSTVLVEIDLVRTNIKLEDETKLFDQIFSMIQKKRNLSQSQFFELERTLSESSFEAGSSSEAESFYGL